MEQKDNSSIEQSGERRRYERTKLIIDIHFDGGEATGIASTRDIGIGGLYMVTQAEMPEGTSLLMRIQFGKETPKELILQGIVVYADAGQGVGVRFQNLSKENEEFLKSLIEET